MNGLIDTEIKYLFKDLDKVFRLRADKLSQYEKGNISKEDWESIRNKCKVDQERIEAKLYKDAEIKNISRHEYLKKYYTT